MTAKLSNPASLPWRSLYGLQEWKNRRGHQLMKDPLCALCLAAGRVTGATIADHVIPHKGDYLSFRLGALRSLCKQCHDGLQPGFQHRGYSREIGLDGYPIDPAHPFNRQR